MKKNVLGLIAASALMVASNAQANDIQPYVGVGVGAYSIDIGGSFGTKAALGSFGQFGVNFGDYVGAELRLGTSGATNYTSGGANQEIKLDYAFSYLGKIQAPVGESVRLYALLGGTTGQITGNIKTPGFTYANGKRTMSIKKTSFTVGGGADFIIHDKFSIGAEYVRYYKDVSGFTANFKYLF